jgi:hypothetical protein
MPTFAELAADALRQPFQNVTRGLLAEALVARLVGGRLTDPWCWVDVIVDRYTLEVKSTGVQGWKAPTRHPPRLTFEIAPKLAWNGDTGRQTRRRQRWADLFVFAHIDTIERTPDGFMDMSNWTFYVVATDALETWLDRPAQGSVALGKVRRRTRAVPADKLRAKVRAALAELEPRPQPWPPH